MGLIYSTLRTSYLSIKGLIEVIASLNAEFSALRARISQSPGIPGLNPTISFWEQDPPYPNLVNMQSSVLLTEAEIVIIGSGITGAAVAKTILEEWTRGQAGKGVEDGRKIVVLEAREFCSGATGRNGGQIKVVPYDAYVRIKKRLGSEAAKKIVEFQMRHLQHLLDIARDEGWDVAECREVETVDVFFHGDSWTKARTAVDTLMREWKAVGDEVKVWDKEEAVEKFRLSTRIHGAISYISGALWPYRFVTSCFSSLLAKYPASLAIETNTPATSVTTTSSAIYPFQVVTPRGAIHAKHVIHATNGHAAHLIPSLKTKLFPIRGHMSAQTPGTLFPKLDGRRSWLFVNKQGFEYIIQRPPGTTASSPARASSGEELMVGGGLYQSAGRGLDEIGINNDSEVEHLVGSHICGVLKMGFGHENWGEDVGEGRIKELWSGIMGFTADEMPLVGKLDGSVTGRKTGKRQTRDTIQPSEWIAAGYNGEGMVHSWLCGVAVALQVLGKADIDAKGTTGRPAGKVKDWLPMEFEATASRIKRMDVNEMSLD